MSIPTRTSDAPMTNRGWFDAHLDLACMAQCGRNLFIPTEALPPLGSNPTNIEKELSPAAVTFPALAEAPVTTMVGTIFIQARRLGSGKGDEVDGPWCFTTRDQAYEAARRQLELYHHWAQQNKIKLITTVPASSPNSGPVSIMLMLEGATGIRNQEDLHEFHAGGVRIISLTWAEGSPWAGGNSLGGDLSPAGRELVGEIDRLQMIHDVSHLGEKAFWSLLNTTRGPICATHSNARCLLPGMENNERHLTNDQIKALLERPLATPHGTLAGGIIGINLYTRFLAVGRRAGINDVVAQIQHICQIAGRADGIGLGSDADGGFNADCLPEGLEHPRHWHRLAEALANAGFTDPQIAGFQDRNWRQFLQKTLG